MCGRFSLNAQLKEVRSILEEVAWDSEPVPVKTGEIYPSDVVPVFERTRGWVRTKAMTWGFPRWDGKGVVFNARAETALEKPIFRKALLHRPAVVPTTGFYEWKAVPGQRKKEKYLFREQGAELLYLAGFYNLFDGPPGSLRERFVILTTAANASMTPFHDRMPILLRGEERESWLGGRALEAFLTREPFALRAEAAEPRLDG